jgi:hypothetical protein
VPRERVLELRAEGMGPTAITRTLGIGEGWCFASFMRLNRATRQSDQPNATLLIKGGKQ